MEMHFYIIKYLYYIFFLYIVPFVILYRSHFMLGILKCYVLEVQKKYSTV